MCLYGVFCCHQSGALLENGMKQRSVGPCHLDDRCLRPSFTGRLTGVIRSSFQARDGGAVLVGGLTLPCHVNWEKMTELGPLLLTT